MSRESQQSADATTAYIALGSNLGDRERTLRSAITALRQLGSVDAVSSFYETAPRGHRRAAGFSERRGCAANFAATAGIDGRAVAD